MHSIYVRICCNNDIIIPKCFIAFLYIQCMLQQIELFILINYFLRQSIHIQRFASQTKYSLCLYVPGFGYRTAGRIAFCDKNGRLVLFRKEFLFAFWRLLVAQVKAAVAQFFIMKIGFFGPLICEFFDAC